MFKDVCIYNYIYTYIYFAICSLFFSHFTHIPMNYKKSRFRNTWTLIGSLPSLGYLKSLDTEIDDQVVLSMQ